MYHISGTLGKRHVRLFLGTLVCLYVTTQSISILKDTGRRSPRPVDMSYYTVPGRGGPVPSQTCNHKVDPEETFAPFTQITG